MPVCSFRIQPRVLKKDRIGGSGLDTPENKQALISKSSVISGRVHPRVVFVANESRGGRSSRGENPKKNRRTNRSKVPP